MKTLCNTLHHHRSSTRKTLWIIFTTQKTSKKILINVGEPKACPSKRNDGVLVTIVTPNSPYTFPTPHCFDAYRNCTSITIKRFNSLKIPRLCFYSFHFALFYIHWCISLRNLFFLIHPEDNCAILEPISNTFFSHTTRKLVQIIYSLPLKLHQNWITIFFIFAVFFYLHIHKAKTSSWKFKQFHKKLKKNS